MDSYRNGLPQLGERMFLTDGGIESTMIFLEGLDLPHFAAFTLLATREGEAALGRYFRSYADIARRFGSGLILESATWRASPDWGARLGYPAARLAEVNHQAIRMLEPLRAEFEGTGAPAVISGCVGPRGDGYFPDAMMSEGEAEQYHRPQVEVFADSPADMVSAITMNYTQEAIGIARAARRARMPVAISFTVETDGRLPTGQSLREAIETVDAATAHYPAYYMINCAHPTHFADALAEPGAWRERIRGLRANASSKSHAQLNDSTELDAGDPLELGQQYASLKRRLPWLTVLGGCCGTDHRHVERIAEACSPLFAAPGLGFGQPQRGQGINAGPVRYE